MSMGVTGYTYDGEFTGIGVQFGDYFKGGALRIATGRANNINYDYTGPMMHGVSGMKAAASQMAGAMAKSQLMALPGVSDTQADALSKVISGSINRTTDMSTLGNNIKNDVSKALQSTGTPENIATGTASQIAASLVGKFNDTKDPNTKALRTLASGLDWSTGTYYPMSNVHMPWAKMKMYR